MNGAKPFDEIAIDMYRDDPQLAADMLNACLADGEMEEFLLALRQITHAFGGVPAVARATGVHEKTLYKTLSRTGNPSLKTMLGLAKAMGMQLSFVPAHATPSS